MKVSLKNYTLRQLSLAFLPIMVIWAIVIYIFIIDEVYDNVDDDLKDRKKEIIALAEEYPETILTVTEYGVGQFRIRPSEEILKKKHVINNEFIDEPDGDDEELYRVLKTGFFDHDGKYYLLEIRASTVEEHDLMSRLAIGIGALYLVLVVSMYIIHLLFVRKVWKPFNGLLKNINSYELGSAQDVIPIKTEVVEFEKINESIQKMWLRNKRIFEQQKTFIENASHELQTPLAITINKLELLMDDESLSEPQLVQLDQAKDALTRMTALNKSLLMLTRIENGQYAQKETVSMNALFQQLITDYQELIDFKELSLKLTETGTFSVEMNKDLATVLASNLLRNAIKYTPVEGHIRIEISQKYFFIENDGREEPLDPEAIFKRFHKGEQDSTSTGLGLAIVKSITDLYNGLYIAYSYQEDKHRFTLKAQ